MSNSFTWWRKQYELNVKKSTECPSSSEVTLCSAEKKCFASVYTASLSGFSIFSGKYSLGHKWKIAKMLLDAHEAGLVATFLILSNLCLKDERRKTAHFIFDISSQSQLRRSEEPFLKTWTPLETWFAKDSNEDICIFIFHRYFQLLPYFPRGRRSRWICKFDLAQIWNRMQPSHLSERGTGTRSTLACDPLRLFCFSPPSFTCKQMC